MYGFSSSKIRILMVWNWGSRENAGGFIGALPHVLNDLEEQMRVIRG
jgi:hypothetical protein